MIGAIDLEMRRNFIPVIKPRSSDLYSRTGYGKRELKVGLSNWHLLNRGLLGKIGNALALNVNGTLYKLKDFQVGSKNDHIIMALRHLINELELKNSDLGKRLLSAKRRFD